MKYFKIRKARKELKEILHYAKHVRHMHEDITDPVKLQQLCDMEASARKARRAGDLPLIESAGEALANACEKTIPPRKHPKVRENIEVLFVAIAAAMAIRAYFFQPFKIPTGSMQPTLFGITVKKEPTIKSDHLLAKIANMVLFGERSRMVIAKESGYLKTVRGFDGLTRLDLQTDKGQTHYTVYINEVPHNIPAALAVENKNRLMSLMGQKINKGDILVGGNEVMKSGDYILVNRMKYNFVRPKRGDIAVFDTSELTHPQVRKDAYYIKRMVGLPNETISVAPKYLLVNGVKPTDPRFDKIFNNENYKGYQFARSTIPPPLIGKSGDSIVLAADQYLFFGDNTESSLDGRYFGAVNRRQILGPAFFVCWPIDRAGLAESSN